MLADAATKTPDGKLYIHGGGWNSLFSLRLPATHPVLALVLTFRLEWHEAHEDFPILIELIDEDGQPLALRGEGTLRMAPATFMKKGTDFYDSIAHPFYGLTFDSYGQYHFRVSSKDQTLATIPISVMPIPGVQGNDASGGGERA